MVKLKVRKGGFIHLKASCAGTYCPEHNPSNHKMKTWKMGVRWDRSGMVERYCPHGVGHPDPDSLDYLKRVGVQDDGTHGCDGCCSRQP